MTKPIAVLDSQWRRHDELFTSEDFAKLGEMCELVWAKSDPIPASVLAENLGKMRFYLSALPTLDAKQIGAAKNLQAVIELYGAFPDTVDYAACFEHKIEVLATGPGMRGSVAEMAVAMALSAGRGLVEEHELFRTGGEHWLNDNPKTDFTMFGQAIGFVGFGQIAREITRLLAPFSPEITAYDPWLDPAEAARLGVKLASLEEVAKTSRVFFVTAAPTKTNKGLVDAATIAKLQPGALVVLVSRAHLIDFDALVAAAEAKRIKAAIDVFPVEPLAENHILRKLPNVILSPHRAAAVTGGRQLMGKLIVADIKRMLDGQPPANLQRARPEHVLDLAGVQHSKKLESMAEERE